MAKPSKLPNGKWRIKWFDEDGVRRSKVYLSKTDAEYKLMQEKVKVEQIKRGLRAKDVEPISFEELCDLWLRYRTSQKRSPKDDQHIIEAHLKPFFSKHSLVSINSGICDHYKKVCSRKNGDKQKPLSPKTVNNHLTLLISMLNYASDLGHLAKAPRIKKPRIVQHDSNFRYLKTRAEIQSFLEAAKTVGPLAYNIYHFAIFSGLRKGEIAGLKWTDVDFEKRLITVQRSFNKPTKNAETRHVLIVDQNLELLLRLQNQRISDHVFPNYDGTPLKDWHRVFSKDFNEALKLSGLPSRLLNDGRLEKYIVFHSLRHTFASHWVLNGGDIFKLQKVLGHKDIKMTQRYAHLSPTAFIEDFDRFTSSRQTKLRVVER